MSKSITVLGMDPAFANWGMCKASLDLSTMELSNIDFSIVKTKPAPKKKSTLRTNLHDLSRGREIVEGLKQALIGVDLVMVEIPVGSQNANGAKSYGVCIGILSVLKTPMVYVTADEVKVAGAGTKNASKEAMREWGYKLFPNANWLTHNGKRTEANEHLADALAAIYAGIQTDTFNQMKVFM